MSDPITQNLVPGFLSLPSSTANDTTTSGSPLPPQPPSTIVHRRPSSDVIHATIILYRGLLPFQRFLKTLPKNKVIYILTLAAKATLDCYLTRTSGRWPFRKDNSKDILIQLFGAKTVDAIDHLEYMYEASMTESLRAVCTSVIENNLVRETKFQKTRLTNTFNFKLSGKKVQK